MTKEKKFGDRKDATRVRNLTGMAQICIDLKPNRANSDVYINQKMDLTKLAKYIRKKKSEGIHITFFHAFVMAIGKVMYNRPKLNYFVANRHLYEHDDIVISFVAKETFNDKSEELMVLLPVKPDSNIFTISDETRNKIDAIREKKVKKEGANDAIDFLGSLPNIIRIPVVALFKW